jgi:hypothetical protein
MATKQKSVPAVTVMSMETISKLNQADAVNLFVDKTTTVTRAFMDSAKLIVHIRSTMTKSQTVHGLLGKKGVRTSTINNAMQAVRVWDDLVVRKLVTEEQFDKLSYAMFVDINAAIKCKGAVNVGPLVATGKLDEVEHIAEHKETSAETKARLAEKPKAAETPKKEPEKKPEPKKDEPKPDVTKEGEPIRHLTEPERKDVTTLEMKPVATPAPAKEPEVTNIVEMPKKEVTLADGRGLLDSLQNVFAELPEADFVLLAKDFMVLADIIVEKEFAIRSKAKAA